MHPDRRTNYCCGTRQQRQSAPRTQTVVYRVSLNRSFRNVSPERNEQCPSHANIKHAPTSTHPLTIKRRPTPVPNNTNFEQVGQRWNVAWRDGTVHLAEIVEIRKAGGASDAAATAAKTGSTENGAGAPAAAAAAGGGESGGIGAESSAAAQGGAGAVYVHYVDFDRRLDEWVGMDRVDLAAGQQKAVALHPHSGDKRRVTTRMKSEWLNRWSGASILPPVLVRRSLYRSWVLSTPLPMVRCCGCLTLGKQISQHMICRLTVGGVWK